MQYDNMWHKENSLKLAKKGISTFDSTEYKLFEKIFLCILKYDQQNLK